MSFGMMRTFIEIYNVISTKDSEGFVTKEENHLITLRAYKENRQGNETWKNRASFTTATALFIFRKPKGIEIKTEHLLKCNGESYNILNVENIREKNMYIEILVEKVTGSKG